ncbi:efflux RND transporter permease subunit [Aliidiomarina halalkaliphila]|uniref:Efflux RND transporter permease subunit n=1 Tax=Aliidiomarina halalkaliphila TaxID=2593535 RepID=A0A552X1H2_9GAMM|nr:efflux RND transporter permease subunit [Aliidiomarina halalkaliphila]TRW48877.1 efflux RND transporter permease subunit [Aliidiomarina halalkaliphila]
MTQWLLQNKLIVALFTVLVIFAGIAVAPFQWDTSMPRSPVAVDAIPNIGENQQIVYTEWAGRSPQDVDDQVSYPLSVQLMGVPGVKDVRTLSMFGFSSISVIFHEDVEFYWSRARILEKLASLPGGTLPEGVQPALGPDATGLGQVYLYTLEGRDPDGQPIGGWDLDELRSVQDWYVRYGLLAAEGISEVASIGGYVREYQIDIDPDALRYFDVTLEQVMAAVAESNLDIGARTTEINQVEYIVRGVGFIKSLNDIEQAVVRLASDNTPIRVSDVASVNFGPAERRGALDVAGAEAVGGVVTVREGFNPLAAIENTKQRIDEIAASLPARAVIDWNAVSESQVRSFAREQGLPNYQSATLNFDDAQQRQWAQWLQAHPRERWPDWLNLSQVTIVPFYDRSTLIMETLGTLNDALTQQLLITAAVVLLMLLHLRAALTIATMLPLAVLMTFIGMRMLGVEANIVALAGIAIAIGTIVDMGIIVTDNILRLRKKHPSLEVTETIVKGAKEVGPAVLTAIATTVISFLPVFTMTGAEGKLFTPLAYTKTLVLLAAIVLALVVVPIMLRILLSDRFKVVDQWLAQRKRLYHGSYALLTFVVLVILAGLWEPLGPGAGSFRNILFVGGLFAIVVGGFSILIHFYAHILRWCLRFKALFLALPALVVIAGLVIMPGLGREFMPPLDEGSFLLMPTTMPHASIGEALDVLSQQDRAIAAIPEVDTVVGKIGRAETALDPAPVSMIETVINYKSEFKTDANGRRLNFRVNRQGEFVRDGQGNLIEDRRGRPYRQWRDHIQSPRDIWDEIVRAADVPGVTSAPRLQPIETRQLMLQTGMRAAMGVKVQGPDLAALEQAALAIESVLRTSPGVSSGSVNAERVVGSPYLEIHLNRDQIARYGLRIQSVQNTVAAAIGGVEVTRSVEGRERYPIRVRYQREQRDDIEAMYNILVATPDGTQVPLSELAEIRFERGPQMIRSENTFLTAYVTFGAASGFAEVEAVEAAREHLQQARDRGELRLPIGVSYTFAGSYQQQQSAMETLKVVIPLSLTLIFILLYLQFKQVSTALMVFSGIAVAWGGGFIMLYLYGQSWFANFSVPLITQGVTLREIFQFDVTNLSVAVWVGFLALFGIAVDDGVVMATYLKQRFNEGASDSIEAIRERVVEAGLQRVRPCLMTSATTILALFPVLTATGRGADLMIPMAIPTVGGLTFVVLTMFVVPVLYSLREEWQLRLKGTQPTG